MTQLVIILSVAALAVAFGLLQRRHDADGKATGCGGCSDCSDAPPTDPAACSGCSLECDHPETSHVL